MNTDWDNETVRTPKKNMAKKNTTSQKNKSGSTKEHEAGPVPEILGFVREPYEEIVHPAHYNGLPNGIECWDVTEHFPGNIAMGIKHLWRAGLKPGNEAAKDLDKALQYIQRQKDLVTGKVNKM